MSEAEQPVEMAGYTWCKIERAEIAEARVKELEAELRAARLVVRMATAELKTQEDLAVASIHAADTHRVEVEREFAQLRERVAKAIEHLETWNNRAALEALRGE